MLFKETVEKDTLSILETLQQDEKLTNFYLVGGTALALKLGHRKSYPYPFVEYPEIIEKIRMYSLKYIAAMKLIAIADSGKRVKDFVDIAYLSTIMSFNEMLIAFQKKYNVEKERAKLSLTYFSDIDFKTTFAQYETLS
jgi:hypothetical protein